MEIAIVGGGPAGLRAAEVAAQSDHSVTIFDARASVGRKFLVAGRGGLNLTHGELRKEFVTRYHGSHTPDEMWESLLADFSPQALLAWAHGMGIELFQAKTGRVYPVGMKAAPMLRRWVTRLRTRGVQFEMHHRLTAIQKYNETISLRFDTAEGEKYASFNAVVVALGGGSWPQTGSDGSWVTALADHNITVHPLVSANSGWECFWPPELLAAAEGQPIKNIEVHANSECARGELLITRYGLEGGCIYQLGRTLRTMQYPEITIDFKPTFTMAELAARIQRTSGSIFDDAVRSWKLGPAAAAMLRNRTPTEGWLDSTALAIAAKSFAVSLSAPRPIAEAISSAGGICWSELDPTLMLHRLPGVFVAGEMIDWEAPTGGYLIQGCLATGTRAGTAAVDWLAKENAL